MTKKIIWAFVTINRSAGITEFQNQLRKAIISKMEKRFKDGLAYWEAATHP